jgi:hypothetical protein
MAIGRLPEHRVQQRPAGAIVADRVGEAAGAGVRERDEIPFGRAVGVGDFDDGELETAQVFV